MTIVPTDIAQPQSVTLSAPVHGGGLSAAPAERRRPRKKLWWALAALLIIPVGTKFGDILVGANFHTVVDGQVYRSAQLSGAGFESHIKDHGIRTVINLRGDNTGQGWYDEEVAACQRLGVRHIDVRMSARELPDPQVAGELMAALHEAPRPILLHCKNGADRSGLAATAFLIAERGIPVRQAEKEQLGMWYGHMPVGRTTAMDRFFDLYLTGGGSKSLPEWVAEGYKKD